MEYNKLSQELHHVLLSEEDEFNLDRAFSIALKICPENWTKQQVKNLTIDVLNNALDDGLISVYDGVYISNLGIQPKKIVSDFKTFFESMTYEEREAYLKEKGFSFGSPDEDDAEISLQK